MRYENGQHKSSPVIGALCTNYIIIFMCKCFLHIKSSLFFLAYLTIPTPISQSSKLFVTQILQPLQHLSRDKYVFIYIYKILLIFLFLLIYTNKYLYINTSIYKILLKLYFTFPKNFRSSFPMSYYPLPLNTPFF